MLALLRKQEEEANAEAAHLPTTALEGRAALGEGEKRSVFGLARIPGKAAAKKEGPSIGSCISSNTVPPRKPTCPIEQEIVVLDDDDEEDAVLEICAPDAVNSVRRPAASSSTVSSAALSHSVIGVVRSNRELARYCLQRVFGHDGFRGVQEDVIVHMLDRENSDAFVVMPTGGGKSLCYALPALLRPGITLVVSPLLSLMQDQVVGFVSGSSSKLGISIPATCLSSEQSETEAKAVFRELHKLPGQGNGDGPTCKLLYVTPEKVAASTSLHSALASLYNTRFPGTNHRMLSRIVIDEAHCVSTWGHDFRPDYKRLALLRQTYPDVQLLALTATATARVREDVMSVLKMKANTRVFVQDFNRPNLVFSVRQKPSDKAEAIDGLVSYLQSSHGPDDVGIIYCLSRDDCEALAEELTERGVSSDFYHAGMTTVQRVLVQNAWQRGHTRIVVATIAFGMGIDHPRVRFVVHWTLSKSMEGYYQEAGRAGRDGNPSHCLIMYAPGDVWRITRMLRMKQPGVKRTAASIALSVTKLQEMVDYCEDTVKCYRRKLLAYFGQTVGLDACNGTCTNCAAASKGSSAASSSSSVGESSSSPFVSALNMFRSASSSSASTSSSSASLSHRPMAVDNTSSSAGSSSSSSVSSAASFPMTPRIRLWLQREQWEIPKAKAAAASSGGSAAAERTADADGWIPAGGARGSSAGGSNPTRKRSRSFSRGGDEDGSSSAAGAPPGKRKFPFWKRGRGRGGGRRGGKSQ